jgi:uncharacterized membrane protein
VSVASRQRTDAALLLGLAAGLRTFSAPAALALRARRLNAPRRAVLLAAAIELIADKLPTMPSRLGRRGLTGRVLSSALCGRVVAGRAGAARGVAASLLGAFAGHAMRRRARGALPALCEDAAAVALAWSGAARSRRATQSTP